MFWQDYEIELKNFEKWWHILEKPLQVFLLLLAPAINVIEFSTHVVVVYYGY